MLGKLTFKAIPLHEPIIMITMFVIMFSLTCIVLIITYFNKWKYLWHEWFTSIDHKRIGIMYIFLAGIMLFRGFADAIMMRTHQSLVSNSKISFLTAEHYNQIFTAHGVIMIFFVAMPFIIGIINIIVPLQIGARDVAFPFLNNLSFWLTVVGVVLINLSLGIGEFAGTGWLAYPPLSSMQYNPGVGVDYWIWSLQISGIGTLMTGINFFVTILNMRAPGMNMFKMPVFVWTSFCTSILIIISFPVLTTTIALLTLDRYLDFHFFTQNLGGNIMMYVNLIWIWGHPEVYILALPIFGIFSEIVATFSRKSLFGYNSLVWATIAITFLSFLVWLHHFFTMGAGANVNAFFGIMTMIIAIPTGVKIFNWIFTMYQGRVIINSMMLWTIGFLITFSIGGMTGVLLSIPGADFILHNSLFLIAHFHNVIIGGVIFGIFAGISYWFPKIFGFTLNENWGKRAFWFWIIGFFISFIPLYFLGLMGMTRRLSQNIDPKFHTLLTTAFFGTIFIFFGILCQVFQILTSIRDRNKNKDLNGDPWNGRTLEWSTKSPPPFYNFAIIPNINTKDFFWKVKEKNKKVKKILHYEKIHMPKNTNAGIFISLFIFFLGFSLVWHIWWLSIFSFLSTMLVWILKTFDQNEHYYVPIDKIKIIEDQN